MNDVSAPDYLLQQTDRALAVLDLFTSATPSWSFMEICRETGLAKPTVKRLVYTLLQRGYLEQDAGTGRYRLGIKLITLGRVSAENMDLLRIATPLLEELRDETGETVALVQIRNGKQIYLAKLDGHGPLHIKGEAGDIREPYWWLGRIILAYLAPAELQPLLPPWGQFPASASKLYPELNVAKGPYNEQEFLEELRSIKEHGCEVGADGWFAGHLSVGVPVFDHSGKVTAALGAIIFSGTVTDEHRAKLITLVKRTAATISQRLGYSDGGQ